MNIWLTLDPKTLLLSQALVQLILAALLYLTGRMQAGSAARAAKAWTAALVLTSVGLWSRGMSSTFGPWIDLWLADLLLVSAAAVGLMAGRYFFSLRPVFWPLAALALYALVSSLIFENATWRITCQALMQIVFTFATMRIYWQQGKNSYHKISLVIVSLSMAWVIWSVLHIVTAITHYPNQPQLIQTFTWLVTMLGVLLLSFLILLLIHTRAAAELRELATLDWLTGLYNRRGLELAETQELARATRDQQALSMMLIDLDKFKAVNDRYGHLVGDEVLRACALVIRDTCREIDRMARLGGDEFCVLLPGVTIEEACMIAERLRAHCEAYAVAARTEPVKFTVSVGVASTEHASPKLLRAAADKALYAAKHQGNNRVVAANDLDATVA